MRRLVFLVLVAGCGGADRSFAETIAEDAEAGHEVAAADAGRDIEVLVDAEAGDHVTPDNAAGDVEVLVHDAGDAFDVTDDDVDDVVDENLDASSNDAPTYVDEANDAPPPLACIMMPGFDCSGTGPTFTFTCCKTSPCTCCNQPCQ